MAKNRRESLSIRERLVLILVVFLIQMIQPWDYSHQFDKFWAEVKGTMNTKETINKGKEDGK